MKKKMKYLTLLSICLTIGMTNVSAVSTNVNGTTYTIGAKDCITLERSDSFRGGQYINGQWFSALQTSDGHFLLCDDATARAHIGETLVTTKCVDDPSTAKILGYAANGGNKYIAQVANWGGSASDCEQAVKNFGNLGHEGIPTNIAAQTCRQAQLQIKSTTPTTSKVCTVQDVSGKGQPFVALDLGMKGKGQSCPDPNGEDPNCHIENGVYMYGDTVISREAYCKTYKCPCPTDPKCHIENGVYMYGDTPISEEQYCNVYKCPCEPPGPKICPLPNGSKGDCGSPAHYYDLDEPSGFDNQFEVLKNCQVGKDIYAQSFNESELSKMYCHAYCVENLYLDFPSNSHTYTAGGYYAIGDTGADISWGPIKVRGNFQCRSFKDDGKTEGVNAEKLINDYNDAVEHEIEEYNNMKNQERKQHAMDISEANGRDDARCYYTPHVNYVGAGCPDGYWQQYEGVCCRDWGDGMVCDAAPSQGTPEPYCDGGDTLEKENNRCRKADGKYYPAETYTTYNKYGGSSTGTVGGDCGFDENAGSNNYDYWHNRRMAIEQAATVCNEFNGFTYNLAPVITATATFDKNSKYHVAGPLTPSVFDVNSFQNGEAQASVGGGGDSAPAYCSGSTCQMVHYECSGDYCTYYGNKNNGLTMEGLNVNQKIRTIIRTIDYHYEGVPTRYASKDGSVYASMTENPGNYIDLGGNVIPISIDTFPGVKPIELSYGNIGNNGHFSTELKDAGSNSFSCNIKIKSPLCIECVCDKPDCCQVKDGKYYGKEGHLVDSYEQFLKECDPQDTTTTTTTYGLDFVYRTIKLGDAKTAFPSIDGDGRVPGNNWISADDYNASNGRYTYHYVDRYITNNRGVKGEEVYNKTPLYSITLTPNIIKEIRKYNSNNKYGDFKLSCTDATRCISTFIHSKKSAGGFADYFSDKATCQNITTGQFYSCADK